ncbi:MAG: hypothetical protein LBO03_02350 [Acidaminococcales bacterium]|jgi:hypothetical protein|nr:hypothetical protein [Acidaminococcales bacterium]
MLKKLEIICSKCQKPYRAGKTLFYADDFKSADFGGIKLICPSCLSEWRNYWNIDKAHFFEKAGALYVNIKLANGDTYEQLDCTAMDDIVVLSRDVPLRAQNKLYKIYKKWHGEKMKDCLKSCVFSESFMRTSFTCETFGGSKYDDVAFRFNRAGILETELEIPEIIKKQIAEKWSIYEIASIAADGDRKT